MRNAEGWRRLSVVLFLLAALALPACVRSSGRPLDPANVPAGHGEKRAGGGEDTAGKKEKETTPEKREEEPLDPKILAGEVGVDAREIVAKLADAEATIAKIMERELTSEQTEQVAVARSFLDQSKAALAEDDLQRAAVLADKGAALARGVEEASRR